MGASWNEAASSADLEVSISNGSRNEGAVGRLRRNALSLLHAFAQFAQIAQDQYVQHLAGAHGFSDHELAVLRVRLAVGPLTLILVPSPIWHGPAYKLRLLAVKKEAAFAGHRCMLVPEISVGKQPRLGNAQLIEQAASTIVTPDQRIHILGHLLESGRSNLLDCACVVDHATPIAAVLSLAASGMVEVDGSRAIGPFSWVDLPSPANENACGFARLTAAGQ